jgi:hypothetical protein
MSNTEQIGLFLLIVAVGVIAGKAAARLARETGIPQLAIAGAASLAGHLLAREI